MSCVALLPVVVLIYYKVLISDKVLLLTQYMCNGNISTPQREAPKCSLTVIGLLFFKHVCFLSQEARGYNTPPRSLRDSPELSSELPRLVEKLPTEEEENEEEEEKEDLVVGGSVVEKVEVKVERGGGVAGCWW